MRFAPLNACPHCGSVHCQSWDYDPKEPTAVLPYHVKCANCGARGAGHASEAEARLSWNRLSKHSRAGQMLSVAAAEVNAREGVTSERFVTLRGRATS